MERLRGEIDNPGHGIQFFEEDDSAPEPINVGETDHIFSVKPAGDFGRAVLTLSRINQNDPTLYEDAINETFPAYTVDDEGKIILSTIGELSRQGMFNLQLVLPDLREEDDGSVQYQFWLTDSPLRDIRRPYYDDGTDPILEPIGIQTDGGLESGYLGRIRGDTGALMIHPEVTILSKIRVALSIDNQGGENI